MPDPTQAVVCKGVKPCAHGPRIDRRVAVRRVDKTPVLSHLCRDRVCSGLKISARCGIGSRAAQNQTSLREPIGR
jgi:hypothetical protein